MMTLRAVELGEVRERFEYQPGALELVLEVGGVDEDRQVVVERELDVLLKDAEFVAGIFIETDLADPEHVGGVEKARNQAHHLAREAGIVGLLRIDAEPGEMFDAGFCGAFWFVFGELAEVVVESAGGRAVEAGPERRLADDLAAGDREFFVVIRRPADHVGVWLDVFHDESGWKSGFSNGWCAGGSLERRGFGDLGGRVGERLENGAGAVRALREQDGQRAFHRIEAEIRAAGVAVDAIEESGEIDHLVARLDELEVQQFLLAWHGGSFGVRSPAVNGEAPHRACAGGGDGVRCACVRHLRA